MNYKWFEKENLCWSGYEVLARQGSVEIRIYSAHQNTLFLSLPVPSVRLGANVKLSSTPFFPQKSFAKKFSKIQGQIWNNPLSNLNLAWEICEAFFCWLFFLLIHTQLLGWVYWLLSSQSNEMIHSVPKPNSIITDKIFLMALVTFNYI